jgi:hypothetical protein
LDKWLLERPPAIEPLPGRQIDCAVPFVETLAWDQLLGETVDVGVDETTSWTDDYNERNNPFTGPIDTVAVEPK